MIQLFQTTFPPSNTPIVDEKGAMSNTGMAFFTALFNRTGQGSGLPNQVSQDIIAAGIDSSTATGLTSDWNFISSGALSAGVVLPTLTGGQMVMVMNGSAFDVTTYPPTGAAIDTLATYSLPGSKMQIFWFISATQIISTQLG